MDNLNEKYSITPERIAHAKYICDNLFYNNYLSTGILNTREEIQSRIKRQVVETATDFYGAQHNKKIQEKVDSTTINFGYQTIGPSNSIEDFLKQTKIANFNKQNGTNFESPKIFGDILKLLSQNNNDIKVLIESNLDIKGIEYCLFQLGASKDDVLTDESLAKLVVSQINDLGQKWNTTQYSENPEINENMMFLESFVDDVDKLTTHRILDLCLSRRIEDRDEQLKKLLDEKCYRKDSVWWYRYNLDPLASAEDQSLHKGKATLGAYNSSQHTLRLGICPDDVTILHEFIHAIETSGFEKGHSEKGRTEYSNQFREYEKFNEVITDYFAVLMYNERLKRGKGPIVKQELVKSEYMQLFDVMNEFLSSYLPELKETRIREYPAEEFMRVVGEDQFKNIAVLCNEMIALSHDRTIVDIAEISGIKEQELSGLLQGVTSNQSRIRQFMNLISRNSEQLASKLQSMDSPHLQRFAQLLYGATNIIENITQQHVAKSLGLPIESLDMENEDEQVMTIN